MPGVLVVTRPVLVVMGMAGVRRSGVGVVLEHGGLPPGSYTPHGYVATPAVRYPRAVSLSSMTTTRGYTSQKDDYLRRLRRIEGQVRGLQRMVADDEYCIDILTQVSAATRALQSVAVGLLDEHLRHCVAGAAVAAGEDEAGRLIDEATSAIERLVKS